MSFVLGALGYHLGEMSARLSAATGAGAGGADLFGSLTQYGPLGLIVIGFLTGWIVPGPQVKSKDAEIKRLQSLFEDQVVPMTQTYATTMAGTTKTLEQVAPILQRATEIAAQHSGNCGRS